MIIGLTGGIASGKTAVSNYLEKLGYPIIDADVLARDIMTPGGPVMKAVKDAFGENVLHPDGSLDRKALGRVIFHNEDARKMLDAITHPAIANLAEAHFAKYPKTVPVFFVVPLLYESGMDALCDQVWLVHAEEAVRQKRLMARDGIDADYASMKMAAQMTEDERLAHDPHVLYNDGDLNHLYAQVDAFLKKCKKLEKKC